MLKDLFQEQRKNIEYFFDNIDIAQAEKILDACFHCHSLIVFTGVGKSGIIAEKIAMTLTSTGTKALYLAPSNFLHGDIGILSSQDLFIIVSKSGETEELLNLIPYIKRRKIKLISIVSNPHSRLVKESDLSISLPMEKELCPFDLAPTTSTAVQLIFGDILAIALMKKKDFSLDEYVLTHPAGTIGKKMVMTVEEIMIKGKHLPLARSEDRLADKLVELTDKKCGCLLVVDQDNSLCGIFTDGDLRRALQNHGLKVLERTMKELMISNTITVQKDQLAWDVLKLMQKDPKKWVMVMPVLEDSKLIGLIRMHDIIQSGIS